jgi:hypothetical protein
MMDWQTFGVIAAVCYLVVLLAGLTRFTGLRNLRNPVNPVNPVPKNAWMVFLVFAVIATVEAQKPTNNVPQNLSAPLAQMQSGAGPFQTGFTGLTGLERPAGLQGLENPVQTTVLDVDIARGYALVEEDDNAAAINVPTNAVTVGNWHLHGARSSLGNNRLDWQGLAAKPNGAPQC